MSSSINYICDTLDKIIDKLSKPSVTIPLLIGFIFLCVFAPESITSVFSMITSTIQFFYTKIIECIENSLDLLDKIKGMFKKFLSELKDFCCYVILFVAILFVILVGINLVKNEIL